MSEGNIQTFKAVLEQSTKIVGFTGAGISTESGISDYRSKGGIWERFKPVYFDEFLKTADIALSWLPANITLEK